MISLLVSSSNIASGRWCWCQDPWTGLEPEGTCWDSPESLHVPHDGRESCVLPHHHATPITWPRQLPEAAEIVPQ